MPKTDLNVNSATARVDRVCLSWEEISRTPKRSCFLCGELTRGRAKWHGVNSIPPSATRSQAFCLPCAIKETVKVVFK
jgi:hypothetical protein